MKAITASQLLAKPFKVARTTISPEMIEATYPLLRGERAFRAADVTGCLSRAGLDWQLAYEAANRLMQRYRKLGLASFQQGYWSPHPSAVRVVLGGEE